MDISELEEKEKNEEETITHELTCVELTDVVYEVGIRIFDDVNDINELDSEDVDICFGSELNSRPRETIYNCSCGANNMTRFDAREHLVEAFNKGEDVWIQ